MWDWDCSRLIYLAGGPTALLKLITDTAPLAEPPGATTIAMWKTRGRISARWLPVVVRGLLDAGHHHSVLTREIAPAPASTLADLGL